MGKRYTEEEKRLIQELAQQGYTDDAIAEQLDRSTNAIRNIRNRNNIKTKESKSIHQLREKKQTLLQQTQQIEQELKQLQTRRDQTHQALQIEETQLTRKLATDSKKRNQNYSPSH